MNSTDPTGEFEDDANASTVDAELEPVRQAVAQGVIQNKGLIRCIRAYIETARRKAKCGDLEGATAVLDQLHRITKTRERAGMPKRGEL